MQENKLYKTAEFASLCRCTKETLFHYDRIGLLKPSVTGSNGYRYYTLDQYFAFDQILLFKEAGFSLSQIKSVLDKNNPQMYQELLESSLVHIKQERKKLKLRQKMIGILLSAMQDSASMNTDELVFVYREKEKLLTVPFSGKIAGSIGGSVDFFNYGIEEILKQDNREQLILGTLIDCSDPDKTFHKEMLFSANVRKSGGFTEHTMKKGMYASLYHKGNLASHDKAVQKMLKDIRDRGATIQGDVYAMIVMSYLGTSRKSNSWMVRYLVRVKGGSRN